MKKTRWVLLGLLIGMFVVVGAWAGFEWSQTPEPQNPATTTTPETGTSTPVTPISPGTPDTPAGSGNEGAASEPQGDVEVLFGELDYEVDTVEFQIYCSQPDQCEVLQVFAQLQLHPLKLTLGSEGERVDYWLLNKFRGAAYQISPEAVQTWIKEGRIAVNERVVGQTHALGLDDFVALQVTEYSALKTMMEDYLSDPNRPEYDLFEVSIVPMRELMKKISTGLATHTRQCRDEMTQREVERNLDTQLADIAAEYGEENVAQVVAQIEQQIGQTLEQKWHDVIEAEFGSDFKERCDETYENSYPGLNHFESKRFLAVGRMFDSDLGQIPVAVLQNLQGRIEPFDSIQYTGVFGSYRLFELK